MDIPSSGAIFTLGKSHLAENTQSYFYIKNDPVKRLISGPHQSAVICESGRLFVWGENHYGQLGIGGHGSSAAAGKTNNNNNNNNGKNHYNDIVTKPTCVRALKTLGLKISDAAYGNNWAVILTLSNEIFYTGRNIFPNETHVAQHFSNAVVEGEQCTIIRKPFRLEEYDDYLSKNEDTDNFVAVQAGNEHFAVLTSTGRLIGCGSNKQQQLGELETDYDGHPVEISLDAPVQQFACGPESTLVLTASGNLFLTGRLNEFVFPRFTELQKNLSHTEQIIFMHISKTSEIYIVTNVGSIYRSFESLRNKSLVFQRFYDYDSEENGPIWKLVKGFSFYAVLTKANKFFTTFSESGHHLKTFREISKFKNLRLLDIAVGDQHILVQGIPRSSTLSATVGAGGEHRFMSRSYVLQPPEMNGNSNGNDNANGSANGSAQQRGNSSRSLRKQQVVEEVADKTMTTAMEMAMETTDQSNQNDNAKANEQVKQQQQAEKAAEKTAEEPTTNKANEMNGNDNANDNNNENDKSLKEQTAKFVAEMKKESENTMEVNANEEQLEEAEHKVKQMESTTAQVIESAATTKEQIMQIEPTAPPAEEMSKPPTPSAAQELQAAGKLSPTSSTHSAKSTCSTQLDAAAAAAAGAVGAATAAVGAAATAAGAALAEKADSLEKQLRPRTPYPESSTSSTPPTIKKTPLRNFSYEAAMKQEPLERKAAEMVDNLEAVQEQPAAEAVQQTVQAIISTPTPPTEEDEQLAVEITTTEDALDSSKVINEIRFINNGIDVTEKVVEQMPDSIQSLENSLEDIGADAEQTLQEVDEHVEKMMVDQKGELVKASENVGDKIEQKLVETRDAVQTTMGKAADGVRDAFDAAGENAKRMAGDAKEAVEGNAKLLAAGARDAVDTVGDNAKRMAVGAKDAVEATGDNVKRMAVGAKDAVGDNLRFMAGGAKGAVDAVGDNMKFLAGEAKDAVDAAGEKAKHMANDAMQAVQQVGSNAAKAAVDTKDSMGRAMGNMGNKISQEMHGAKENISSLFQIKAAKEATNTLTPHTADEEAAPNTNTTVGSNEEDERTTASVNSNHTSAGAGNGNANNDIDDDPYADMDPLDAVVERSKKAMQEDLRILEEQRAQSHAHSHAHSHSHVSVEPEEEQSKSLMRQFLDGMRLNCRNEKAIQIEDEPSTKMQSQSQPSVHLNKNKVNSELSLHNGHGEQQQQSSRVCTIL